MNHIYYFSGTKNTEVISEKIVDELIIHGEEAKCYDIAMINKGIVESNYDYTRIAIGFPVHAFNMPSIVEDFIKQLPQAKGRKAFVFQTAGDYYRINHSGLVKAKKLLQMKGYDVIYEKAFVMGSNFWIAYSKKFVKQLYSINIEKINFMIDEIINGVERHVSVNKVICELTEIIHEGEEKLGAKLFGLTLKANNDCTLCGKCVRGCPVDNISISDGRIIFGSECMWCMNCVYICPVKAIEQQFMKRVIIENGYNIRKVIEDESIDIDNYKLDEGVAKRFESYFKDLSL